MNGNEIQIEPGFFFGQMASVLGGLFLLLLGAAILYSIAYWRLRAQQFEGVIIGIRRRGAYFHSVYRYALPGGEMREATSVQGGSSMKGRTTGRRLEIRVMADHPGEARESAAPVTWAVAVALVLGGGWLTYYSVTMWKRSAITWILFAVAAAYVGRRLWRWLAPYLTKMHSQLGASDAWSALPIESAETLGLSPEPNRFQVTGSKSRRTGAIFCIAGLAILAAAYIPAHRLLLLRTGTRTEGTVLRLESNTSNTPGNNHPGLYPVVQFTSTDGTIVHFLSRAGSNPSPYKVGDHVTVLYQPGKQDTAMIDRGVRNWEPVGAMLLLGAAFTTLGFVGLRARSGSANHTKESRQYEV
jgi:Protein of unknown function (DUF3592)